MGKHISNKHKSMKEKTWKRKRKWDGEQCYDYNNNMKLGIEGKNHWMGLKGSVLCQNPSPLCITRYTVWN